MPGEETDPGTEHYFTERPRSPSSRHTLRFLYRGRILLFVVDRGVFAASALDPGTALLIESLDPDPGASVLDVGCGWGAVGLAAACAAPRGHVVMVDVNKRAASLARLNVSKNALPNAEVRVGSLYDPVVEERFDLIVSNPPYRAGRPLVLGLLEGAEARLNPQGRLLVVGKGSQGILFYQRWLQEHWGEARVAVLARRSGYRVLEARKG